MRLLLVEDSPGGAEQLLRALRQGGLAVEVQRVATAAQLEAALDRETPDLIVAAPTVRDFSPEAARAVVQRRGLDVPFLVLGGTGEAKEALRRTERTRLEAQVILADRLSALGTVAAGVAHEINHPLSFLVANLPLALERLRAEPGTRLAAELEPLLRECLTGAERISAIVRDLRVFTQREEAGAASADVAGVAGTVLRMLRTTLEGRVDVVVSIPRGLPEVALAEPRLAQVLTNLLSNAAEAFPPGTPAGNRIALSAQLRPDGFVGIDVADNGPGIPAELHERIFEPFFTTKASGVGTGLGLSVCRSVVTAAGGRIELESRSGAGSTFRVLLRQAAPGIRAPAAKRPEAPARRARVLLIDDEPNLLRVLERSLHGFEVTAVLGGEAALERLDRDERFDAVVCDLMMPGVSGMDVHARLLQLDPALAKRAIYVTGGAFTQAARAFVEQLSPAQLLEKPFRAEQLSEALRRLLA